MKFKNHYNNKDFPAHYERNTLPSKTVPDQSMSVKEIMRRYASGLPIGGQKVPVYEGEEDDMPDLTNLDLAERQEIYEEKQKELWELKLKMDAAKNKKAFEERKKKDKQREDDELEKLPPKKKDAGDDEEDRFSDPGAKASKKK